MGYIQPKTDYKDGEVLYGIDLNASNEVIKSGVDDNFDRIQGLEESKQDVLTAGAGIQIEDNVISNISTVANWGNIQGTLEDQTDLKDALDSKQDVIDSSNKLDYSLLDNTPSIPSKTSDLTNDSGFIDNTYHDSTKQDVLTAGTGIDITGNVISNTQTSAEWGSITGTLEDQTDLNSALGDKQDTLVSGTNIKTINNISLLGSGDIQIGGGSGGTSNYNELANKPQINGVTLAGNQSTSDLGINIPTKVSDLNNDSGFIDKDVNNLTNYPTTTSVNAALADKVDKVSGKQLSTEDYTTTEKTKLSGIEAGAEVNVSEIAVGTDTPTEDTKLQIETMDLDAQYEEINDIYSTSEIKTNKIWIDGSPIYRRVIQTTTPSAVSSSQATQIYAFTESVKEIVNLYGWLTNVGASSNVERMAINNYYASGNVISTYVTLYNKIMMKVELARYTARPVNIVVEYTKSS